MEPSMCEANYGERSAEGGSRKRKLRGLGRKLLVWVADNAFVVGLMSIVWFLVRTGTKPSRAAYPCQRAAAANGYLWLATYIAPVLVKARRKVHLSATTPRDAVILLALLVGGLLGWSLRNTDGNVSEPALGNHVVRLSLENQAAQTTPASEIFVVNGTAGNDGGVAELIDLMGEKGLLFYQSENPGRNKGPTGLIASDDVVIVKVNCQWDERGGTNTDLLKAIIHALVSHPEGFMGEIIVADNGQAQYGSTGRGGSLDYSRNNAEDISQSVQTVVDSFVDSYDVSTYLWDTITTNQVAEYADGDSEDGYVVSATPDPTTGALVAYPKFRTEFGTPVSFKRGIWNPETKAYDADRLKVLNVPVLKSHAGYGVTACVKHYMGVTSDKLTARLGSRAHNTIRTGGMGSEMAETRYPVLNILDAIWVNAIPLGGPRTRYNDATRTNVIAAGTDPVALDYWAAKHILIEAAQSRGATNVASMDPDNTASRSSFGHWLRLSMEEITKAGHQATVDEVAMTVHVSQL